MAVGSLLSGPAVAHPDAAAKRRCGRLSWPAAWDRPPGRDIPISAWRTV